MFLWLDGHGISITREQATGRQVVGYRQSKSQFFFLNLADQIRQTMK